MTARERDALPPLSFYEDGITKPEALRRVQELHREAVDCYIEDENRLLATAYTLAYALVASLIGVLSAIVLFLWWATQRHGSSSPPSLASRCSA